MSPVLPEGVDLLIPGHLGRQRWFSGDANGYQRQVTVVAADELAPHAGRVHRLLWAVVEVPGPEQASGRASAPARYQLLLGERPNGEQANFLSGRDGSVLGSAGDHYYYDATVDPELALALLGIMTKGAEVAARVRPVGAEQSNTSLVYDDRLIAKVFRRLHDGPNPDVVVTEALAEAGFSHVAAPVAVWRRAGTDLGLVQQYLAGGTEGWALALTSLRDLYASRPEDPADAGGDFAAEASRLGRMTADMHLAMAQAFDVDRLEFRTKGWLSVLAEVERGLRQVVGAGWSGSPEQLLERLRTIPDPGPAIRVHGDYHLGQVMRTDGGWYVLDFEGEPARAMDERLVPSSALKDVTAMLRSFHYAANFVLAEREEAERGELSDLAEGWERHNRSAFLEGYLASPSIGDLLPERPEARAAVSLAFELQKSLYELAYERAYRPDWAAIPASAIQRILAGSFRPLDG